MSKSNAGQTGAACQYEVYRKVRGDGSPWKDWGVRLRADGAVEVVFGAAGGPMQARTLSDARDVGGPVDRKLREGYSYLGRMQLDADNRLRPAAAPVPAAEPEPEEPPLPPGALLYWALGQHADARQLALREVAAKAPLLTGWKASCVIGEEGYIVVKSDGYDDWTFDVRPDGLHDQGLVEAGQGPAPALLLLHLARTGLVTLAADDAKGVDWRIFRPDAPWLQFDGVTRDALTEAAEAIGLILPEIHRWFDANAAARAEPGTAGAATDVPDAWL